MIFPFLDYRVWSIAHDNITFKRLKNVVIALSFSDGKNANFFTKGS